MSYEVRYEEKGRYTEEHFRLRRDAIDRLAALDRKGIEAEVWQVDDDTGTGMTNRAQRFNVI